MQGIPCSLIRESEKKKRLAVCVSDWLCCIKYLMNILTEHCLFYSLSMWHTLNPFDLSESKINLIKLGNWDWENKAIRGGSCCQDCYHILAQLINVVNYCSITCAREEAGNEKMTGQGQTILSHYPGADITCGISRR